MKPIDVLKQAAENIPDADHIWHDDNGDVWFRYLVEYKTPDGLMVTDLWAKDIDHAEWLLEHLKDDAEVVGQAYKTIEE